MNDDPTEIPHEAAVEGPPEEAAGGAGRGPGFVVAVSLAVVFALTSAVLAVLLAGDAGDEGVGELRRTAGQFAEALVTYDYHDPTAHRDAVLALSTGSFRQDYEDAFDQGLRDIITEVEAVSTASVNDVFLSSIDGGQAQAVVSLDIEVSGTSGPRTLLDQYVLLTLVELDDGWRVDQVTDLSFPSASTGAAVTSDTSTSSPITTTTQVP